MADQRKIAGSAAAATKSTTTSGHPTRTRRAN